MPEVELVIPLVSEAGNVWTELRSTLNIDEAPETDAEEELICVLPVNLEIGERRVCVEARLLAEDVAAGVVMLEPVVIDPVPGDPGIVDENGRVDGRTVLVEER